ncbi:hypothetical protein [Staphylococcus marylandisciuri]|uniref:hypothetical protein n=1 Tax=Staphylococcus marylandisciuri TaxID=2981529 RepID=UPI0021CFE5CA|nr:hypothetical protein [Staphylococcus marylandisciuri]
MSRGPNTKKLGLQFPQAMQVGVGPQHKETGTTVSTSNASWGGAPTQRNWFISFHQQCKLGWTPTKRNW